MKKVGASLAKSVQPKLESPEHDYEAQNHLDTLIKAHGIMSDPAKMEKVHKLAGRHHKAIMSIKDIKDRYNEKFGPKKKAMVVNDGDGDE